MHTDSRQRTATIIHIVMGTLVFGTQYGVITALYQICTSDIKGQSVGKFYIYWCNWNLVVFGNRYGIIIALYQICISDIKG